MAPSTKRLATAKPPLHVAPHERKKEHDGGSGKADEACLQKGQYQQRKRDNKNDDEPGIALSEPVEETRQGTDRHHHHKAETDDLDEFPNPIEIEERALLWTRSSQRLRTRGSIVA